MEGVVDRYDPGMLYPPSGLYVCESFGGPRRLEVLAQRRQVVDMAKALHKRMGDSSEYRKGATNGAKCSAGVTGDSARSPILLRGA